MGLRETLKTDVEANKWWEENKNKVYYEGDHIITEKLPLVSDKYDYEVMPDYERIKLSKNSLTRIDKLVKVLTDVYHYNKNPKDNDSLIRIGLTYPEMYLVEQLIIKGVKLKDVKKSLGFTSNKKFPNVSKVFNKLLKRIEGELDYIESYKPTK